MPRCLFRIWFSVFFTASTALAGNGTLLILQNPSNSSPRIVSMWGGGGSEQIILKSDGTVWDWGMGGNGQLGNGTTNNADFPQQVLGPGGVGHLTNLTAILGGEIHNFALKSDGTVWSWGWNIFGQLGDGSANWGNGSNYSATPVQVTNLTSVKSLGGRGYHSLALKNDGTVWTWGCNTYGELGIGVTFSGTNTPVQVVGLANPAIISGGGFFSLALMPDGTVRAWGQGAHGECGNGTNLNCTSTVQVSGLSNIVAISGGWNHALALKSDGTVWAWGNNGNGELGDNTTSNRYAPVQVLGLSNIVSVSAGDGNSMARKADGTIWKWGVNQFGELGNGSSDSGSIPHPLALQVPALSNIVLSACRDYHNICVKNDGTVWVWGDNRYGGCGDLTGNPVLTPRLMPGLNSDNLMPYGESFESYVNGASLVGTNFWTSDHAASAVVTATNYTLPYNGSPPISGPQQNALQISGTVTNSFLPSFCTNVWADMILQAVTPGGPVPAPVNASFAVCVDTNGKLAVWNCTNPPAPGNGWTELQDVELGTNQFFRLTIGVNYRPDANGIFYYNVWVNGVASTNPAVNYAAADSSQPWFGQIVTSGNFLLDDLVVGTNKTFYALLASSTGYGGSISPAGPVIVMPGATNTFLLSTSNWYDLASVTVDGAGVGTPASYTFNNIQSDHSIVGNYVAQLATNNTPKWWLFQQNPGWAANFDAAAMSDPTGKGMAVWQDYIAGTDPMNPASVVALSANQTNGQTVVSQPTVATTVQYQLQRYYALQSSTNLMDPSSWQDIPGWTNLPGSGQAIMYTNASSNPAAFFRSRVWLGP